MTSNDEMKNIDLYCGGQGTAEFVTGYDAGMTQVQQTLEAAVEAHRAGKLAEAEKLYKEVLAADQNHADAWRLLGVVASQVGEYEVAVQLIGRAVQIRP